MKFSMKFFALITILFFAACTKETVSKCETPVVEKVRKLTNAENREEINRRRIALNLPPYPSNLIAVMFFSDYVNTAKVGDIFYNRIGINEAMLVSQNGSVFTTFEGVRDSARLFHRRLHETDEGLLLFPCNPNGEINDSADVYQFHKF